MIELSHNEHLVFLRIGYLPAVSTLFRRRIYMTDRTITLAGTIQKLIDRSLTKELQEVQIGLRGAGHLYDELRIPNTLGWEEGKQVEVTIRLVSP
jgi:hypothetical protein